MACHLEMGASPSIQDFGVGSARARSEEPVQERVESLIYARQQCIEAVKSPERLSTCGQSAGRSSERPSHLGELPAMGRGMRKSPSESALELSSSGDWDTIPAFQGDYGQGSKRQALAAEVLGMQVSANKNAEWLRQQRKGCSRSWQSGSLGESRKPEQSPRTQWNFPPNSDSDSVGQSSSSTTMRHSEEGEASCCRRSLESAASSKEDAESNHFDVDGSSSLTDSLLNRTFSVNLGISERKSLLSSLTEGAGQQRLSQENSFFLSTIRSSGIAQGLSKSCASFGDHAAAGAGRVGGSDADDGLQESCTEAHLEAVTTRSRSGSYMYEGQAAAELFLRLNHARQTVSFVRNQAARFSVLRKAEMTVWEALEMLSSLREYETALMDRPDTDPNLPLLEHAYQTAEACRLAFPYDDWLHLVGLIHSLGKLLAHPSIAGEPQWAICGESFPVGCRFDPGVGFSHFFSVNPDRRCRAYSTPTGIYRQGGGLASVYMSWSAAEYLYMLLLLNRTLLPPQALFIVRYQKFLALEDSKTYRLLMCKSDQRYLPWLARFRALSTYRQRDTSQHLTGDAFRSYYSDLIRKYMPAAKLRF